MSATGDGSSRLDLAKARARLAAGDAPAFWRSLDELAGAPGFRAFLDDEFPRFAEHIAAAPDRRSDLMR
jgi:MoCo/4Fe-4S cofactor protein with predicted Tat translocation signal